MLRETFKRTLNINVDEDSVQSDFAEWDSLGHIKLILALEKDFDKTFDFNDIYKLTSYKALEEYILN